MTKYQFIPKAKSGKRWAIADIHGCCKTFKTLIDKIALTQDDQLFLLGDYISRGPHSVGVIDFILELQNNQYQVFPLKGNHEDMLLKSHLNASETNEIPLPSKLKRRKGLIDEMGRVLDKYIPFYENLSYYYETDDFYLVHAGFNLRNDSNPLEDYHKMMWLMRPNNEYELAEFTRKKLVHGHFSTTLSEIREKIEEESSVIPLDNGCYKCLTSPENNEFGNLCALNLDNMEFVVQKNVDMKD